MVEVLVNSQDLVTNARMNVPTAHYWLSAASTGYAHPEDWIGWADSILSNLENPPYWIIEVSLSGSLAEFKKAIFPELENEDEKAGKVITVEDSQAGFYFLMYKEGRLTIDDFLEHVFNITETGRIGLSPERISHLMLEVSNGQNMDLSHIDDLMLPFSEIAYKQWHYLMSLKGNP